MKEYLSILERILEEGVWDHNERTRTNVLAIPSATFQFDMGNREFPLLTTKKLFPGIFKNEMDFFLKGKTDKNYLRDKGVHIWDLWASKLATDHYDFNEETASTDLEILDKKFELEYIKKGNKLELKANNPIIQQIKTIRDKARSHFKQTKTGYKINEFTDETKNDLIAYAQIVERDLGPIYGWQWNHQGASYMGMKRDYEGKGTDQLKMMEETLKTDPTSRRIKVVAWTPSDLESMALTPCHDQFQIQVIGDKLHLNWGQRSVDAPVGLPYNIAFYGGILASLANIHGYKPGMLTGELSNTHIYENQMEAVEEQLKRKPSKLPTWKVHEMKSIKDFTPEKLEIIGYEPQEKIKMKVAQ